MREKFPLDAALTTAVFSAAMVNVDSLAITEAAAWVSVEVAVGWQNAVLDEVMVSWLTNCFPLS